MNRNYITDYLCDGEILTAKSKTYSEYVNELLEFQERTVKLLMGDDYAEGARIHNAISYLNAKAAKYRMNSDVRFIEGIKSLECIDKEIAISMAGKKAEDITASTLGHITRKPVEVYRNVYLTDGVGETEADFIVLTRTGIVILEVKSVKSDVTFSDDGHLLRGTECYEKRPIVESMAQKRRVLTKKLEESIRKKGMHIPICVDSIIVLSTPRGMRISVVDNLKTEKWCYRTSVNHVIDRYVGNACYSSEEMEVFNETLKSCQKSAKPFEVKLDFALIRESIADMVVMMDGAEKRTQKGKHVKARNNEAYRYRCLKNVCKGVLAGACIGAAALSCTPGISAAAGKAVNEILRL